MGRKNVVSKENITKKAFDFINKNGITKFSARKLAAKLNIATMTIYNYFDSLDAIIIEVINTGFILLEKTFFDKYEKNSLPEDEPLQVYPLVAEAALDFAESNENIYKLMFSADIPFVLLDTRTSSHYGDAFSLIRDRFNSDEVKIIHDHIYLYEVLMNALIMNYLYGRSNLSREECIRLNKLNYKQLLEPLNKFALDLSQTSK